jgi:outer membrane biosynthesis protein TonB
MKRYLSLLAILLALSAGPVLAQSSPDDSNSSKPAEDPGRKPPSTGVAILSDPQGVDFKPYLAKIVTLVQNSWEPLIPNEVNTPPYKKGQVKIRFSILPSGRLEPKGMILEGRSGDMALDRAAWGAIVDSELPPLPVEFKGPRLTLRFLFQYNPPKPPATPPDRQ